MSACSAEIDPARPAGSARALIGEKATGKPDRKDAAPAKEIHLLSSLCDAISESCKQAKADRNACQFSHFSSDHPDASPNRSSRSSQELLPLTETPSFRAHDLLERSFLSAQHAEDVESPRLVRPPQPVENDTSVATQRNLRPWRVVALRRFGLYET
jgi:hypothetical protein